MTNPTTITAEPGVPFVDIVRELDAPIDLVFRAYADPELIAQWLGPRKYTTDVTEWNFADGGAWAYSSSGANGENYGFRGSFHSIEPGVRIVQTFEFLGAPGHVSLESAVFDDLGGGRTRVTGHSVFQSVEARDAMVEHGMSGGVIEGYERLDELLARESSSV